MPVSNPQEAIERMIQEKKLSTKINYDVLKNLNKDLVSFFFNLKSLLEVKLKQKKKCSFNI
jgi:hypothetical protein